MTDPLQPLRDRFLDRAKTDRAALEILSAGDRSSDDLRRLVHNLAGVAGTFGFAQVSEVASLIDDQLALGHSADAAHLDRLKSALDAVEHSR